MTKLDRLARSVRHLTELAATLEAAGVALVKRAGLPRIRFHDLRHTHATLLLTLGVNPKVVQERLGHSQISMTLDTYSHVVPSLQRDAARRIDDLFASQDPWQMTR